jgi:hypothetical protein
MTSYQHYFSVYEKYNGGEVYHGDDSPLNVIGHGKVLVEFFDRRVKGINGVFHISNLTWNLLSVSKINDVSV